MLIKFSKENFTVNINGISHFCFISTMRVKFITKTSFKNFIKYCFDFYINTKQEKSQCKIKNNPDLFFKQDSAPCLKQI